MSGADYEADAEVLRHFEKPPTIEKAASDFFRHFLSWNAVPRDFFHVCSREFADSIDDTGKKLLQKDPMEPGGGISEFIGVSSADTNDRLLRELKAYAAAFAIIQICSGRYARILRQ